MIITEQWYSLVLLYYVLEKNTACLFSLRIPFYILVRLAVLNFTSNVDNVHSTRNFVERGDQCDGRPHQAIVVPRRSDNCNIGYDIQILRCGNEGKTLTTVNNEL